MSHAVETEKPNVSSSTALWAVLIFVGLIIAAINFVQAERKGDAHGGHGAATEHHDGAAGGHQEGGAATHHDAGTGHTAQPEHGNDASAHDSAVHGEHHEAAEAPTREEAAHH